MKNNFPISHNFSINKIELHRAMVSLILQIKNMHISGDKHCINKKKNQISFDNLKKKKKKKEMQTLLI